ncbi:hypothetical protein BV898_17712 [Hypsibius exemplaris]|uniref:Uncharacterized protein n=1 Tax=Hypsibius exemplaris TaxID=2072580 RepID=A0A9X6NHF6_HYPEX|nr:hypothetical protein BV898_17712 [Hypsibius exemplaris]
MLLTKYDDAPPTTDNDPGKTTTSTRSYYYICSLAAYGACPVDTRSYRQPAPPPLRLPMSLDEIRELRHPAPAPLPVLPAPATNVSSGYGAQITALPAPHRPACSRGLRSSHCLDARAPVP